MYSASFTGKFKKDYKLMVKRGCNIKTFEEAFDILTEKGFLPATYNPHKLFGNWKDFMECHLEPDWLLIYKVNESEKDILFVRTGTHADLF